MFWLNRKKLSGSYFFLSLRNSAKGPPGSLVEKSSSSGSEKLVSGALMLQNHKRFTAADPQVV